MFIFIKKVVKVLFLAIIPLLLILSVYIYRDVYCDFGIDKTYSIKYWFNSLGDFSAKKLVSKKNKKYNTFIFGSSRSNSFFGCYIKEKIFSNYASINNYYFGNWNESIGGIYEKLNYLDKNGYKIDNAFILLDTDHTFEDLGVCRPWDNYLFTHKPKLFAIAKHFFDFLKELDNDRIKILLGSKPNDKMIVSKPSDPVSNDQYHYCYQKEILYDTVLSKELINTVDSLQRVGFLYKRDTIEGHLKQQISEFEKEFLLKISAILKKHNTSFAIVITPLYDQKKFNILDQQIIDTIFADRVFDFSGINSLTDNPLLYPDRFHYNPINSKRMIDSLARTRSFK